MPGAALGGIWRRLGWLGWAFCPVPREGQETNWEIIGTKGSVFQEKGTVRRAAKEKWDLRSWRRLGDFSRKIIGNSGGDPIKSALESHKIPKKALDTTSGCKMEPSVARTSIRARVHHGSQTRAKDEWIGAGKAQGSKGRLSDEG